MTPERWREITGIFHAALAREDDDRRAFVAAQCGDDAALRGEVEAMLAAHQAPGPFSGTPSAGAAALAPGGRLGTYEVVSFLGAGGMGEVYLARDTGLDRNVALKVLPPNLAGDADRLARFEREARLLASVDHPNIAAIHGLERADGRLALVLEYVVGTTLAERLSAQSSSLSIDQVLTLARAIAGALSAAHRVGVVHRDLKPSNIMVTRSGAKLLDFGLAKVVERSGADSSSSIVAAHGSMTARSLLVGTVPYMAPEQLRGATVDHRCDIFAFGVVMYEMVAGQHPFVSASDAETIAGILERSPPLLHALREGVPPRLDRFVQKCLEKDPEDRWQNTSDMVEALEWVQESRRAPTVASAIGQSETATGHRPWHFGRVRPALMGAVFAGAIAIGAVALSRLRPTPQAEATALEFVVPPEPGTSWGVVPRSPNPAASPNGRYIAVLARGERGSGVWLHDLESGSARLLVRTDSGTQPFWSPDSSTVAFCDRGGVRTAHLDNRPTELVAAPGCVDGSWHAASGWLLSTDTGLVQVSPRGGTSVPVTTVNAAHGELAHVFGRWLPDGVHFVFLIRAQTPETRGIYVGSVGNAPPRRLVNESANPVYVTEGNGRGLLLYVRGSTLVAQELDERTLTLLPNTFSVGQRVRLAITARSGSFDATDRLLVFRSGGAYQPTRLIWLDRSGRQIGEVGPDEAYRLETSLSADERTLLYGRFNEDTNLMEIWTTDLERGVSAPLYTSPDASLEAPLWSPDGSLLAYLSSERGFLVPWLVNHAGERRPLETSYSESGHFDRAFVGAGLDLAWMPDGQYLVRTINGAARGFRVDGGGKIITVLNRDAWARVSPDGRWVAYASSDTGQREVYVERFGGGGQMRVSVDGGFSPTWRSDGTELFFRAPPDRMMAVGVRLGDTPHIGKPYVLFRAPFEASGQATAGTADYLVTKDAQRFLITVPVIAVKPLTARLNWRTRMREPVH
jgi:serine/threonine protein kinase/Tol biopolymer transport system component